MSVMSRRWTGGYRSDLPLRGLGSNLTLQLVNKNYLKLESGKGSKLIEMNFFKRV